MKNDGPDTLIYCLRPDNTALWIPEAITWELGLKHGDKLTPDQMASKQIFALLEKRLTKKAKPDKDKEK